MNSNNVKPADMSDIEFDIIRRIVSRALNAGFSLSVIDDAFGDGECTVVRSHNSSTIIGALATTGSDRLCILDGRGRLIGSIALVYNGDDTVVQDHTANDTIAALVDGTDLEVQS